MSEMNVISVVKYKVKDGFENEFVEAFTEAVGGDRAKAKEIFGDLETSDNNWQQQF